ncbi:MAG TPA: class I SAM-dependent methyltransferase [Thermoanaerobaculia bacterium]|nr:class I SAM-dependent methyltransferase [Thermoanaerobaculia bacterium]
MSAGPPLPYRDFYYPLNVFMHILTHEEGGVTYLHYGLFDGDGDSIAAAQQRSTELLLSRLPAPPARLLDVGVGLGTTLDRLTRMGYAAEGITPDDKQIAMVRARYGDAVNVHCTRFEDLTGGPYDAVLFQESSQYIDSATLFAKARELTNQVIVLDEFAFREEEGATLHRYDTFLAAAGQHSFRKVEEVDLSDQAAPTVDYFNQRLPRYRDLLHRDLGLTSQQVDDLIESGHRYRNLYARGVYGYRLIVFLR